MREKKKEKPRRAALNIHEEKKKGKKANFNVFYDCNGEKVKKTTNGYTAHDGFH